MTATEVKNESNTDQKDKDEKILIRARSFQKSFDGTPVLKNITFDLHHKENLVVLGKSGSGKSVLIKSMVGLHKPTSGELKVLDYDINGISDHDLVAVRRKVGYLFQGGALYDSMTVRENMRFPLERQLETPPEDEINQLVEEGLESVGLGHTLDKMPAELSGGMQKRIALARTLVLRPKIMLYDEPTTGLDPVTSKEISNLLLEMRERYDITSIVVTHDMSSAEIVSDRMFILREGEFGAEGTYDELSNSDDEWVRSFFE